MSPHLRMMKARDVMRILRRLDFVPIRQRGSHLFFEHADGRKTSVPIHGGEDIGRGLLYEILRQIEMTSDEFLEYL